jgi:hypothetical protein
MYSASTAVFATPLKKSSKYFCRRQTLTMFSTWWGVNFSTDSCCVLWRFQSVFCSVLCQQTVAQLVREFLTFCGIRGLLPCPQETATCPYADLKLCLALRVTWWVRVLCSRFLSCPTRFRTWCLLSECILLYIISAIDTVLLNDDDYYKYYYYYLSLSSSGAFAKLRKETITLSCLSVCPHGTFRLLLDGFSWNLMLEYFSKIYL